jgi:hypothetical protein
MPLKGGYLSFTKFHTKQAEPVWSNGPIDQPTTLSLRHSLPFPTLMVIASFIGRSIAPQRCSTTKVCSYGSPLSATHSFSNLCYARDSRVCDYRPWPSRISRVLKCSTTYSSVLTFSKKLGNHLI